MSEPDKESVDYLISMAGFYIGQGSYEKSTALSNIAIAKLLIELNERVNTK